MKMIRPDWDLIIKELSGAYVACSCGAILETIEAIREHWQRGHFDYVENEPCQ